MSPEHPGIEILLIHFLIYHGQNLEKKIDLDKAEAFKQKEHYGLDKVKERMSTLL